MLRKLRDLFGQKEGNAAPFPFSAIDGWADSAEEKSRAARDRAIDAQKKEVDAALATIRGVIPILAAAEIEGAMHAKLGMVVKKSLPQYLRAMEAGLDKPLPDGGEEFYTAAVEVLKGILRATTNQGRYLRAAFPDEMQAIRQALDRLGKAVNTMTGVIRATREELAAPQAIRALQKELLQGAGERARLTSDLQEYSRSIGEHSARIQNLQADLGMRKKSDRYIAEQEKIQARGQAEEEGMVRERAYRNTALIFARVLERAEKSVSRTGVEPAGKALHAAVLLLREGGMPLKEDLENVLPPAIATVRQYIDNDSIPLKSKEERELCTEGGDIFARIVSQAASWEEAVRHAGDLQAAISASPVLAEVRTLETAIAAEEQHVREDEKRKNAAGERLTHLETQEQIHRGHLEERLGAAMGKKVEIDWNA